MATAYQLVPLAWLRNQVEPDKKPSTSQPVMSLLDDDDEQAFALSGKKDDPASDILSLLSPRYHKRARILLRFAQMAGAKIDEHQRIVYANTGQIGSTLYELLTYAMLTPALRKNVPEPLDYVDFMRTLDSVHCPRNLYARVVPSLLSVRSPAGGSKPVRETKPITHARTYHWFVMHK